MQWRESANYVGRYQVLYNAGVVDPAPLTLPPPPTVVQRLSALSLRWASLPSLLQRALIWDAGFVLGFADGADTYVQVYTNCTSDRSGVPMGDIAVNFATFLNGHVPLNNRT
ncbi:hypothetical protein SPRG_18400, partial [Saprolegnia parasitica CBS 223.65]